MTPAAGDDRPGSTAAQRRAAADLVHVHPVAEDLGHRFAAAGHALHLVGGPVRDALLGRHDSADLDLTTDATPDVTRRLLSGWAEAVWDVGARFGTIAALRDDVPVEITTYRTESYDPSSRKPDVVFGDDLAEDLVRRDFTVNAMALSLPDRALADPTGGLRDLAERVLRTPGPPGRSFDDDPLRMMRAARFVAQLGFTLEPTTLTALRERTGRLQVVSAERVRDELSRLLLSRDPRAGLEVLVESGLAEEVLPELPLLLRTGDEHGRHKDVYAHSLQVLEQAIALEGRYTGAVDLVLRLAALLHDVGKPRTRRLLPGGQVTFHHHEVVGAKMTRRRLEALRYPKAVVADVSRLVELHLRFHGYGGDEGWTDAAVRRYVRDAGPLLDRLHALTRADCTTRNRRKAARLAATYDDLERRIAELSAAEEVDRLRPDLDGNAIMELLGVGPGPVVGRAYRFLLELRTEHGPQPREAAEAALLDWAREQGVLDG